MVYNSVYGCDTFEPPYDKTNKMACAPSEDSDQTGHPPNLIRVFAVRMKKHWVPSYPLSAQRRLWSDWAESFCWFCHVAAHLMMNQVRQQILVAIASLRQQHVPLQQAYTGWPHRQCNGEEAYIEGKSLSRLVFRAGCGIRLYRFLIIAFLYTLYMSKHITLCLIFDLEIFEILLGALVT